MVDANNMKIIRRRGASINVGFGTQTQNVRLTQEESQTRTYQLGDVSNNTLRREGVTRISSSEGFGLLNNSPSREQSTQMNFAQPILPDDYLPTTPSSVYDPSSMIPTPVQGTTSDFIANAQVDAIARFGYSHPFTPVSDFGEEENQALRFEADQFGQIHYTSIGQPVNSFSLPSPLPLVDSDPNIGFFATQAYTGSHDVNDNDHQSNVYFPQLSSDYPNTAVFAIPEFGVIMRPTNSNPGVHENVDAIRGNHEYYDLDYAPGTFSVVPNPNNSSNHHDHPNHPVDQALTDTNEDTSASNLSIDYFHYRDQHRGYQLVHHESDPDEGSNVSTYSVSTESLNISTGAMKDEDCMFVNFPHPRVTDDHHEDQVLITASSSTNNTVNKNDDSFGDGQRSPSSFCIQGLDWSDKIENSARDA
ncbi:unnamed protein product [Ambrosiozyma monospora]|uniref:Unnamed protein product n=1 Tax=Ambrosiozyma monospora TaxID=43982 RepID=A0A9W7DGW0_AMBMO|nr:unnamed protein product [Ambrosiozyma monospora]